MINNKQRKQYLRTQIQTASREQLVLMLYNGVLRFAEAGKKALEEEKFTESHEALMRAQAIIMELFYGLDNEKGGEVATNLNRLYTYGFQRLIVANMKRETEPIDEVVRMFREIRDGWSEAMGNVPQTQQAEASKDDTVIMSSQQTINPAKGPDSIEIKGEGAPPPPASMQKPKPQTATKPAPTARPQSARIAASAGASAYKAVGRQRLSVES